MSDEHKISVVGLNVGGVYFETTSKTLSKSETLLNQYDSENEKILYIDRDPYLFPYVLNYMRNGELVVYKDRVLLESLKYEAKYFKLPQLELKVSENLESLEENETTEDIKKIVFELRKIFTELQNQGKNEGRVLRRRPLT